MKAQDILYLIYSALILYLRVVGQAMIFVSLDFNIPIKSLDGDALVQLFDDDEAQSTGSAFKDVFKVFVAVIVMVSLILVILV